MSRFFISINSIDKSSEKITITGDDVKHIKNVLRGVPGDVLILSDGNGTDYEAEIEAIEKDRVIAGIIHTMENHTEPPVNVTLFQGIPKSDKMDYIVQKCVELGVNRIIPVITERTVVRFKGREDAVSKTSRWSRIALEAAKQCDRGKIPVVGAPISFDEVLSLPDIFGLKLFPYEEEAEGSLNRHLEQHRIKLCSRNNGQLCNNNNTQGLQDIAVLIGPEGGFTADEANKAVESGFKSVTLGPRILRSDTAGVAVAAIIMYELGGMKKQVYTVF